jgi:CubicO group peptidase (beta-lactamase class C family)
MRDATAGQSMLYRAQEHYQYSNLGISLAGEAVEAVGKKPFVDQVRGGVLAPLGMTDTTAPLPMALYGNRMAIGYGAVGRDGKREQLKPFDTKAITPAAGFVSTVEDLGKFMSWQLRVAKSGKTDLLSAATLRDMQRVHYISPDWEMTRGLGYGVYRVDGNSFVGHSGECPGYFTAMIMNPASDTGVVVMMNAAQASRPYWRGIHALLGRRGTWSHGDKSLSSAELENYAGHYSRQPWGAEAAIVPWAGGLAYLALPSKDPNGELEILKPSGTKDIFRRVRADESEAEEVRFERDASGKVVRLVWHGNPNPKID